MTATICWSSPNSPNNPHPTAFDLTVRLGAGDDLFTAAVMPESDPSMARVGSVAVAVEGDAGNDDIVVQVGDPNGTTPLFLGELSVAVGGGAGADEVGIIIIINNRVGALDQQVDLGAGDDAANLESRALVVDGMMAQKVRGGAGNDVLNALFSGEASADRTAVHASLFGGAGDDRFRLLWDEETFNVLAFVDGGAGFDTGLFSPSVRHVNVEKVDEVA
jgi:hypothetical protein